ncbi:MAG: MBL fold metallo-hydrolase [Desulfobacca sp.]|nr:MBL fold metallo-hydrolase [Desulfobacca sp.]
MIKEKHFGPIWFIPGKNNGKYPCCHSIYIEGDGVLIDPASDLERLVELKAGPGVREVWLSHWHEDHFMHLDLFEDRPLGISKIETPPLSDLDIFLDWYGLDIPEYRAQWRQLLLDQFHFQPRVPSRLFEGNEVLTLNSVTVEVIHSPGHTPGHLAFFFREPGVLFLGDYDLGKFGPWYGDLESSIEETISSIQKLRRIPARTWITGHETGLFELDPADDWDRYLGIIAKRESKLLEFLNRPRTMAEIISQWIVYRKQREPVAFFEFGEKAIMGKHLERLLKKGTIKKEGDYYWVIR